MDSKTSTSKWSLTNSLTPKSDKDNFGKANVKDHSYGDIYDRTLDVDPNSSRKPTQDSGDSSKGNRSSNQKVNPNNNQNLNEDSK